jgi:LCP family protein required for cell wall assembly
MVFRSTLRAKGLAGRSRQRPERLATAGQRRPAGERRLSGRRSPTGEAGEHDPAGEPYPAGRRSPTGGPPNASPPGLDSLVRLRRRPRWPRRLLVAMNAVVLCLLLLPAGSFGYIEWRFSQVKRVAVSGLVPVGTDAQGPPGAGRPMTILLVGSDTRNLGQGDSAAFGNDQQVTGQRSDTIVLARIVPATSSVALLSIPRDLLVQVPGLGTTRVNAAFDSGPDLLVKTIEQDFGIDINHFAVVNFATFIQVADAVGGVYVYFPTPARDLFSGLTVTHPGCVLLKGAQALAFVRSREYQYLLNGTWQYQLVPESDLARIQRQQAFIKLALKKAERVALLNPFALNRIISGLTSSISVDSGFSPGQLIKVALALRHANATGIPNWTYPTVNSTTVPGALDPVPSLDSQVVQQFLSYGMPRTSAPAAVQSSQGLSPSAITVQVLNGSGRSGQAAQAASELRADGFKVASTGNGSSFDYTRSVVEYGPGGAAAARLLQSELGGGAVLQSGAGLSGENLVLVTGQTFAGVSHRATETVAVMALGGLAPETTPPDEIQPDASSYYHGQYVPPGLGPGQVPKTCPQ